MRDIARWWAGYASLGAGMVHVAVIREHLSWWAAGAFFVALAGYQLAWGVAALVARRLPLPRLTLALTAGTLLVWVVSRTVGLPLGPDAGVAEAVGTADTLTGVLELLLVAAVVGSLRAPVRPPASRRGALAPVVGLVLGATVMAGLTTPALAATAAGGSAQHHH